MDPSSLLPGNNLSMAPQYHREKQSMYDDMSLHCFDGSAMYPSLAHYSNGEIGDGRFSVLPYGGNWILHPESIGRQPIWPNAHAIRNHCFQTEEARRGCCVGRSDALATSYDASGFGPPTLIGSPNSLYDSNEPYFAQGIQTYQPITGQHWPANGSYGQTETVREFFYEVLLSAHKDYEELPRYQLRKCCGPDGFESTIYAGLEYLRLWYRRMERPTPMAVLGIILLTRGYTKMASPGRMLEKSPQLWIDFSKLARTLPEPAEALVLDSIIKNLQTRVSAQNNPETTSHMIHTQPKNARVSTHSGAVREIDVHLEWPPTTPSPPPPPPPAHGSAPRQSEFEGSSWLGLNDGGTSMPMQLCTQMLIGLSHLVLRYDIVQSEPPTPASSPVAELYSGRDILLSVDTPFDFASRSEIFDAVRTIEPGTKTSVEVQQQLFRIGKAKFASNSTLHWRWVLHVIALSQDAWMKPNIGCSGTFEVEQSFQSPLARATIATFEQTIVGLGGILRDFSALCRKPSSTNVSNGAGSIGLTKATPTSEPQTFTTSTSTGPFPTKTCERCRKEYTGKYAPGNLNRHHKFAHAPGGGYAIQCQRCQRDFRRPDNLKKHLKNCKGFAQTRSSNRRI